MTSSSDRSDAAEPVSAERSLSGLEPAKRPGAGRRDATANGLAAAVAARAGVESPGAAAEQSPGELNPAAAAQAGAAADVACAERPLRKDAERNRQRVLAAAGELFAARGLAVTLDDIARHAGVGVGTVYRRFPDKETLIEALFAQRIVALADLADEALAFDDPWEGFTWYFERGSEAQARDRGLKELLSSSVHGGGSVADARARLRTLVTEVFDRAKSAGVLRADLDPTDAPLIQGMISSVMDRSRDVAPDLWRRFLVLVLDGLRPDGASPLPVEPLSVEQLDAVLHRVLPHRG